MFTIYDPVSDIRFGSADTYEGAESLLQLLIDDGESAPFIILDEEPPDASVYWYTYASTDTYLLGGVYTSFTEADDIMDEPMNYWTVLAGPEPA